MIRYFFKSVQEMGSIKCSTQKLAFDKMARASPISRLKSTEPRRVSLSSISLSKRSDASPVNTGTAAISDAIFSFYFYIVAIFLLKPSTP